MPNFVVFPNALFVLLLLFHGNALSQELKEEPGPSLVSAVIDIVLGLISNRETNADADVGLESGTDRPNDSGEAFAPGNSSYCDTETTTIIAKTNPGWSTNTSSGNLQEDFGLSQSNATATAMKMISDLKKVSLLPSDILRAVDALTALEKEYEKELDRTENDRAPEMAKEYMADVIEVSGEVLEEPNPWQELTEADSERASGKMQATVTSAAVKVAELLSNGTEDFETENLHVRVSSRPANDYNVTTRRYDHIYYPNTCIELPELFYRDYVDEDNNVRVVFMSYTTLHSVTNTIPLDPKQASPDVFPAKGQVNSGIINVIVGQKGLWRAGDGETTKVKFGHVYKGDGFLLANPSCVWWDEAAYAWNTSGCALNYTDAHVTICRCNHLTSLALLMDVRGFLAKEGVRENPAYLAGKWLTLFGCSASAICLVLCIVCILALKQLRETTCWKTRCHLCVSLLLVQLLVMGLDATEIRWLCLSVAVWLHFAMLSAFTWGAVESFNMYMKFGKVWRTQRSLVKFYVGVGYGFPAVVVSTTLAVSKTHGYYTETTCWLAPGAMMWTFFGIVALILAINLLAFVMVMRLVLARTMKAKSPQPAGTDSKGQTDRIWGTLTIFLVLGLTWLTGILYAAFGSTVLAIVFILTNSFQGVWIFIFGLVLNRRVREDAVKLMLSWRKGKDEMEPSVRFTNSNTRDAQVDKG
ncbi:adhesion G protein-coupled receptor L3-like [Penaeus indicus]|uniref:adhesion G protein-coupled receptor L3-like n=1 Tax=Penaeus indicus TaxID=29960 RepID=UPI00300D0FDA